VESAGPMTEREQSSEAPQHFFPRNIVSTEKWRPPRGVRSVLQRVTPKPSAILFSPPSSVLNREGVKERFYTRTERQKATPVCTTVLLNQRNPSVNTRLLSCYKRKYSSSKRLHPRLFHKLISMRRTRSNE